MAKYDGWIVKNRWGSLLRWTMGYTIRGVKRKVPHLEAWKKEGHKIVKFKIVEVA